MKTGTLSFMLVAVAMTIVAGDVNAQTPMTAEKETVVTAAPEKASDTKAYITVEQMPIFPGGNTAMFTWIAQNLRYPSAAAEQGIQGKVVVQFIVEKDGSISNVKVLRGKEKSLDTEAMRVVGQCLSGSPA